MTFNPFKIIKGMFTPYVEPTKEPKQTVRSHDDSGSDELFIRAINQVNADRVIDKRVRAGLPEVRWKKLTERPGFSNKILEDITFVDYERGSSPSSSSPCSSDTSSSSDSGGSCGGGGGCDG